MKKNNNGYSIEDILSILPHRQPFVLIDKVIERTEAQGSSLVGSKLVAIKNVSYNEAFFAGHFPHRPVMPGVLIIESMAQAGALASYVPGAGKKDVAIGRISEARFHRPVVPGDQLKIEAEVIKDRGNMLLLKMKATVDDELVTEVEVLAFVSIISDQVAKV